MIELNLITCTMASLICMGGELWLITHAQAQVVTTDKMTCSLTVATYEKNRRIHVKTRSGTALPIYSGVPVSQKQNLKCGRTSSSIGYFVNTMDDKKCVAFYKCG